MFRGKSAFDWGEGGGRYKRRHKRQLNKAT